MYSFSNTLRESSFLLGVILIAGGIYFCYFSYKYEYHTRFFTGIVFTQFIALYIIMNHAQLQMTNLLFWVIIIVSLLAGLIIGWIMSNTTLMVASALGFMLAFIFTQLFYQSIIVLLNTSAEPFFWVMFALTACLALYLGCKFPKFVFIISCAFLGSYAIIRVTFSLIVGYWSIGRQLSG